MKYCEGDILYHVEYEGFVYLYTVLIVVKDGYKFAHGSDINRTIWFPKDWVDIHLKFYKIDIKECEDLYDLL